MFCGFYPSVLILSLNPHRPGPLTFPQDCLLRFEFSHHSFALPFYSLGIQLLFIPITLWFPVTKTKRIRILGGQRLEEMAPSI